MPGLSFFDPSRVYWSSIRRLARRRLARRRLAGQCDGLAQHAEIADVVGEDEHKSGIKP